MRRAREHWIRFGPNEERNLISNRLFGHFIYCCCFRRTPPFVAVADSFVSFFDMKMRVFCMGLWCQCAVMAIHLVGSTRKKSAFGRRGGPTARIFSHSHVIIICNNFRHSQVDDKIVRVSYTTQHNAHTNDTSIHSFSFCFGNFRFSLA